MNALLPSRRLAALVMVSVMAGVSASAVSAQPGLQLLERVSDTATDQIPVLRRAPSSVLRERLQRESGQGGVGLAMRLDRLASRIAGAPDAPTWLLLSDEEGGFVRRGFWLMDGDARELHDEPYIEMVVDHARVDTGDFEDEFCHEVGHVLLRRLFPAMPLGLSRAAHRSWALTDEPTAFDEGFAEHMQAACRLVSRNPQLHRRDVGLAGKDLARLWPDNLDASLRIQGVRQNTFVHRQTSDNDVDDACASRAGPGTFDTGHLRNGAQMLATEGVLATVFYRYLAGDEADHVLTMTRYEALFRGLRRLNEVAPSRRSAHLLPGLLGQPWPQDGERLRLADTLVSVTFGLTMDAALMGRLESLAGLGAMKDVAGFTREYRAIQSEMKALSEMLASGSVATDRALPNPIWLCTEGEQVQCHDANVATACDLVSLGFTGAQSAALTDRRRGAGLFKVDASWLSAVEELARDATPLARRLMLAGKQATPNRRP